MINSIPTSASRETAHLNNTSVPARGIGFRLMQTSFWLLAQRAIDMLLAFAFTWIALRRLGPQNFGLIVLTQAVLNLSSLLTLNLESSLVKIVPDLRKEGMLRNVRLIIGLSYVIKLVLALVFASLLFVFATLIASFYHQPALATIIPVACLSFVAAALADVGAETNLSLLHPEMRTLMTTIRRLVEVSGLYLVLMNDAAPWKAMLVLGLGDVVAFTGFAIAVVVFISRLEKSTDKLLPIFLLKRMFRFSFPLLGARLAEVGSKEFGKLILGAWISPSLLAFYGVARLAVERLIDIFSQAPAAAVPVISGNNQAGEENQVVVGLFRFQVIGGVLASFGLFSLTYVFLSLVGGEAYLDAAAVVRISSLVILLWAATASLHVNFLIREKTFGILLLNGSQILTALVLYPFLIPLAAEKGAAMADVAGQIVAFSLGLFLSKRWFGFPSLDTIKQYIGLAGPALVLLSVSMLMGSNQWLGVAWVVVGGLLYLIYLVFRGQLNVLFEVIERSPYFRAGMGQKVRDGLSRLKQLSERV